MVRDSVEPDSKVLAFTRPEWATFLRHVRKNNLGIDLLPQGDVE